MFIVSEYILSKTKFSENPNKLSTMSIVFGLICYGALYFYLLTYYRDTLPFINQYLVYFIALDLIISIFYYYKHYKSSDPTLISSFFDKSQNGEEEDFNVEEENSDKSESQDDVESNVDDNDEEDNSDNENDLDDNESDITDIQLENDTQEIQENVTNELNENSNKDELESIDQELQDTLEKLQEKENNNEENINKEESQSQDTSIQDQPNIDQLDALQNIPVRIPKKRGRKPKNFISI